MNTPLKIYNSMSRQTELFEPLYPPFVGMYVCGPTVYGDPHLGHARPAITFDILLRYLRHLGYKVRYVRNITDVGHLENDADAGDDKIAKKARVEQLEPMEIAQLYTDRYFQIMERLNVERPSIEPRASGHIIEQIEMIRKIIDAGYAYEINGSVYFDVHKYNLKYRYGKLSGRKIEDLINNTRELAGQEEKRNTVDFALWKKAMPEHIMRWPSPWGDGFPGWHIECSVMSTKYLGNRFDIHGGGMDLLFPHHESEIAQSCIANQQESVKYWMHNNMVTINGQKMGKSLGNFITLEEFFSGKNNVLQQPFDPMTIRFFILQAHYRSTVDFSNEALLAAERGLKKLRSGMKTLKSLVQSSQSGYDIPKLMQECYDAMDDDLNTPVLIAKLFEGIRIINQVKDQDGTLTGNDIELLKILFETFFTKILGIREENSEDQASLVYDLMALILDIRKVSRAEKDFRTSDLIRDALVKIGVNVKDTRDSMIWEKT